MKVLDVAAKFLEVRETGFNQGKEVQMFQRCVSHGKRTDGLGDAGREAWCMAFVQYCVHQVEINLGVNSVLFASEHCLTVLANTPKELIVQNPQPGDIVIWQHGKTSSGHTGFVTAVSSTGSSFETIEGNTGGAGTVIKSEGDGVYRRSRSRSPKSGMKIRGFIRPFDADKT